MVQIVLTQDGSHTLFSEEFGVTYHSRFGAITETEHVFINAGLRYKAVLKKDIRILETGFGTGLNALMTCLAAQQRGIKVEYTALEQYPLPLEITSQLNYPQLVGNPTETLEIFKKMHQIGWDQPSPVTDLFTLEKKWEPIQGYQEKEKFDIIYFDAFAPQAQPELWSEEVFQHMFQSIAPDGILVTYCAQGAFKRRLKATGFWVEALHGPPGKREMTRAGKP